MRKEFKISYETVGTSSYMAVTLSPEAQLVHYQMEMMVENRIKNLLPAFKRVNNGELVLYYNITSQIPLSQVLEKRKLTRGEFIHLLEGAIYAVQDIAEYRLPETGLLMSPEYIYVNPSSCDPNFMFVPVSNQNTMTLKALIQDLVMKGQIELTQDNFIQVILEILNENVFSLDHLEQFLKQFRSGSDVHKKTMHEKEHSVYEKENPVQKKENPVYEKPVEKVPEPVPDSVQSEKNGKEPVSVEGNKKKIPSVKQKNEREKENEFDPEKAKKMFMLPQAVIMIAITASVSFGLFVDESGTIAVKNIIAAVILLVLTEVILYREAYVNSKIALDKGKEKEKKSGKMRERKNADKMAVLDRKKADRPSAPVTESPENRQRTVAIQQPDSSRHKREFQNELHDKVAGENVFRSDFRLQNDYASKAIQHQEYGQEETDSGDETELWGAMEINNGKASYLEYYENGNTIRIPLNNPNGVIIGRLRSQADFIVTNARVGKVHAKFYEQNGQYYVVDINSKNGTFVNGKEQRIQSNIPYPLYDNDRIMLADSEFIIRCPQR